jgi:hypothetical protein
MGRVGTLLLLLALGLGQRVQPPAPKPQAPAPTPRTAPAPPPAPSAPAAPTAAVSDSEPSQALLGVSLYPNSQYIGSYDAGRGQRFYLFGSSASYIELVTYYRTLLKQRGTVVFEAPATHQFDIGRFREETMAFPPSVTIKDYQSQVSAGYPNPRPGGQPARFPTIVQIVPSPPGSPR